MQFLQSTMKAKFVEAREGTSERSGKDFRVLTVANPDTYDKCTLFYSEKTYIDPACKSGDIVDLEISVSEYRGKTYWNILSVTPSQD